MEEPPAKNKQGGGGLSLIGQDIHRDILSRLPAPAFASAACVSRSWSHLCNQILTRPIFLSALSLNPNLNEAIHQVLNKALSKPIRPHFAIAYVGRKFNLRKAHSQLSSKLGSGIPIIVSQARGIIGTDVATHEHKEVQWMEEEEEEEGDDRNRGVVLTLGFLPGLKVCAIPLRSEIEGISSRIDKFVTDVKDFTASPVGVIMFAEPFADMKPVLEKMDYAMPKDTIIIGNESGHFLCNFGVDSTKFTGRDRNSLSVEDAVGLVFATDRGKPQGEIRFSLAVSSGVSPIGPIYKGASVIVRHSSSACSTWLTARREGSMEVLDGVSILNDIEDVMENNDLDANNDLYIGVSKRRKCSIGSEKGKFISTTSFHEVSGGDEEYLYVEGAGIKTGDTFQFFHPDPQVALISRNNVFENLKSMKESNSDKTIVCGGLIFPCYGRGESFLGSPNVDSSAFLANFPGVPLSGVFCSGEIGRGCSTSEGQHNDAQRLSNCYLHVYSTMYLLILHTPSRGLM